MRVLVTGATGFLGCRVAERLVMGGTHEVRALLRRGSAGPGLPRIGRLPVEFAIGDVLDPVSLEAVLRGCQAVVHCAYGSTGSPAQQRAVAEEGTENLLEAAHRAGVERFIHISSIAVHGFTQPPDTDEDSPLATSGPTYVVAKAAAERAVVRYRDRGLGTVILRPTKIHGPYSGAWTVSMVERIRRGAVVMLDRGEVPANVVYIDNVVDLILLGLEHPAAVGETFIVSDEDPVTWREYLSAYADLLPGRPELCGVAGSELAGIRRRQQADALRDVLSWPRKCGRMVALLSRQPEAIEILKSSPIAIALLRRVMPPARRIEFKAKLARQAMVSSPPEGNGRYLELPEDSLLRVFATRARFSSAKARRLLGYRERISFEKAMRVSGAWLRYAGIID